MPEQDMVIGLTNPQGVVTVTMPMCYRHGSMTTALHPEMAMWVLDLDGDPLPEWINPERHIVRGEN